MIYSPVDFSGDDDFSHLPTVDLFHEVERDLPRGAPVEQEPMQQEAPVEQEPMPQEAPVKQEPIPQEAPVEQEPIPQVEWVPVGFVPLTCEETDLDEPADNRPVIRDAKINALALAASIHVALLLILSLLKISATPQPVHEIVAFSEHIQEQAPKQQKVAAAILTEPAALAAVKTLTASNPSQWVIPEVPFDAPEASLNLGTSFGTFGGPQGIPGGGVSFLGNRGSGRHLVFVVDVSGSMSARFQEDGKSISRFDLLKRELIRSLGQIREGINYQVIYFSHFAWPHDELDSNDFAAMTRYEWDIRPGQPNVKIPTWKYLSGNAGNLRRSRRVIEESNNPGGTNWGAGLLMALTGSPKPDIIFFMTDGNAGDAETWVEEVTKFNQRGPKRTVIHTTAMMEPGAAEPLEELARRNGGKFTVVLAGGRVITGEEYFKELKNKR